MDNENQFNNEMVFSKRVKAGRRRTYFFDVRTTRANDFFITITESKRRFDGDGFERHKLHLYKEDFNKFFKAFGETVEHVKSELMPDYDYDEFSHEFDEERKFEEPQNTDDTTDDASDDEAEETTDSDDLDY